jgi:hypothetical protein
MLWTYEGLGRLRIGPPQLPLRHTGKAIFELADEAKGRSSGDKSRSLEASPSSARRPSPNARILTSSIGR